MRLIYNIYYVYNITYKIYKYMDYLRININIYPYIFTRCNCKASQIIFWKSDERKDS